jgi:SnoaL-like domain
MDNVFAITNNVAKFAYRDQGRWDELRDLFHPDATIAVTWYSGPIDGFIERSAKMAAASKSVTSKHWIGASRVTVEGGRAVSDTDVAILVRTKLGPVEADVTSYLRFFDRFERRVDGVWRIASRTAIYEKDRIDPVRPSALYPLIYRLAGFDRFPGPYRHLAAGLVRNGQTLAKPIIEAGTKEEAALWRDARAWLAYENRVAASG